MKDKELYQIEMTSKQMDVMASAMEFYSRFLTGQISHWPKELEKHIRKNGGKTRWDDQTKNLLSQLKKVMFPEMPQLNAGYGVGNSPIRETDIAYEMYREILVQREVENPSDGHNVFKSPTRKVSAEPLMKIKDITRESKIKTILKDKLDFDVDVDVPVDNCGINPGANDCGDASEY